MSTRRARVVTAAIRSHPYLGGVETHVAALAPQMTAIGYDMVVASTDLSGELPVRESRDGVLTRRFRAWPKTRDYYASPGLFLYLLRARYDLLHVQGVHTLVPPVAMLAATVRRKPFVLTFHSGGSSSRLRSRMRTVQFRLLGPLIRRASALIAVSEYEAERFAELLGVEAKSVTVIRNGGSQLAPERGTEPEPGLILSIGRLEQYKGHHRAIAALSHLKKWRPDARLMILGAGPYEAELRSLVSRLGLEDCVSIRLIDPSDRQQMAAQIAKANVCVLLSDYEACPVAVMEALSLHRPAVVLETSGLTELVEMGWAAGVGQDEGPEGTAKILLSQMEDPILPVPSDLPTWSTCAAQTGGCYSQALSGVV